MSNLLKIGLDRDDLQDRLGGGLPAGSLVVLTGPNGAGKSILVQRFLYGLIQNKHSLSLVSTELTTAGFLDQMSSLQYDVEQPILEEQLVFVPVHPIFGARAAKHDLLHRILQARLLYTKEVVIFDTLSKFLGDHLRAQGDSYEAMEQIEAVLHLFKRLTSIGKTIIVTLEDGQVKREVSHIFTEAADVLINLDLEISGGAASRRIVVNRLSRAANRFGEIIGYRVEPGLGLVIEIKSVV
jgi:archaeal flagellar protein FlaH